MEEQIWEKELQAWHRWGKGEKVDEELKKLHKLWKAIQPIDNSIQKIIAQMIEVEICVWNLEENILLICQAIGTNEPIPHPIGHGESMTEARWLQIWAYYLSIRLWISSRNRISLETVLSKCDSEKKIRNRVFDLLGPRTLFTDLKGQYLERLCLAIEAWFEGISPRESAHRKALSAAVLVIENEIRHNQIDTRILDAITEEGGLQPCHHKIFRRIDIILSSIAEGQWRGKILLKGSDGIERADLLYKYLTAIAEWLEEKPLTQDPSRKPIVEQIYTALGPINPVKKFLTTLFHSLLLPQESNARKIAEIAIRKAELANRKSNG